MWFKDILSIFRLSSRFQKLRKFDTLWRFLYILAIPLRGLLLRMSRSLKKGPFVDIKLMKKVSALKPSAGTVIKTWARRSQIAPEFVGFTFGVHNGQKHIEVL